MGDGGQTARSAGTPTTPRGKRDEKDGRGAPAHRLLQAIGTAGVCNALRHGSSRADANDKWFDKLTIPSEVEGFSIFKDQKKIIKINKPGKYMVELVGEGADPTKFLGALMTAI